MIVTAATDPTSGFAATDPTPSKARMGALFLALTVVFVLVNPHWYPDAAYYASSILRGPVTTSRSGHALWVPTAELLTTAARTIGLPADPLRVLQIMTALATAGLVLATYALGRRLRLPPGTVMAGSALLGLSSTGLLMGGSGYPSNVCALGATIALTAIIKPAGEEWSSRDGAIAVAALTAAWGSWALIALAYPTFFLAAFLYSNGGFARRLLRAVVLCGAAGVSSTVLALFAWRAAPDTANVGFVPWLLSASHNYILDPVPLLDTLRSFFGLIRSFVELGTLGFAAKTYLLGDHDAVDTTVLFRWGVVLAVFTVLAGSALVGLILRAWRGDLLARRLGLLALTSAVATVAFAIFYGGTELHMHATAMPLLCLAAIYGMAEVGSRLSRAGGAPIAAGWGLVAFVGGVNLFGTCLPDLASRGGLATRLAASAAEHIPAGSLIVVTGQDFRGNLQGLVEYRAATHLHNISAEVDQFGSEGWGQQLTGQVQAALKRGGKIAVLSDLIGEPTPGGIELSVIEYPEPTAQEVAAFFATWTRGEEWTADRFRFVNLTPPAAVDSAGAAP